ncbi:MAG: trypsin-like peptidase domain-containing protein [Cyclobacteriaceae bacterium]
MTRLILNSLLFFVLPFICFSQAKEDWITAPKEQWPQIVLTNHVQYRNGDRYIDPSFNYAGNGFLIDTGRDTLAATVKHVLWVARNKKTKTVRLNRDLNTWIMKPKGDSPDSVVIDQLINEDSTEVLEGSSSTILDRDWIVFTVKNAPRRIHPLKPRYTSINPGETVYIIAYSYNTSIVGIHPGKVLEKPGMDILIKPDIGNSLPGLGVSGSPVIDANGFLIGIYSTSATDPATGKNISVAAGTEYLKDVLSGKPDLNAPKKDYGELIMETVLKQGTEKAIQQYVSLTNNPQNYYIYNLRSANRNGLRETGEKLIRLERFQDAVDILEFNVKMNPLYYRHYNLLAKAWFFLGNKEQAIKNYEISITRYDDREENEAFKELAKLGVTK